jgi:hypothetical protein
MEGPQNKAGYTAVSRVCGAEWNFGAAKDWSTICDFCGFDPQGNRAGSGRLDDGALITSFVRQRFFKGRAY